MVFLESASIKWEAADVLGGLVSDDRTPPTPPTPPPVSASGPRLQCGWIITVTKNVNVQWRSELREVGKVRSHISFLP